MLTITIYYIVLYAQNTYFHSFLLEYYIKNIFFKQLIENKLHLAKQHLPSLPPSTVIAVLQNVAVTSDPSCEARCRNPSSKRHLHWKSASYLRPFIQIAEYTSSNELHKSVWFKIVCENFLFIFLCLLISPILNSTCHEMFSQYSIPIVAIYLFKPEFTLYISIQFKHFF